MSRKTEQGVYGIDGKSSRKQDDSQEGHFSDAIGGFTPMAANDDVYVPDTVLGSLTLPSFYVGNYWLDPASTVGYDSASSWLDPASTVSYDSAYSLLDHDWAVSGDSAYSSLDHDWAASGDSASSWRPHDWAVSGDSASHGFDVVPIDLVHTSSMLRLHEREVISSKSIFEEWEPVSGVTNNQYPMKQAFIEKLANELFKTTEPLYADERTQARASKVLPELLIAFALRIGHNAKTQMHRTVMAFVYKHRREIADKFMIFTKDPGAFYHGCGTEGTSWQDHTSHWSETNSFEEWPKELTQPAAEDDEAFEHFSLDQDGGVPNSWFIACWKFIISSGAYKELITRLQREFHLIPGELNIMEDIREAIMASHFASRQAGEMILPPNYHVTFQLDWNIIEFFKTQDYSKEPHEVFERVITITGSCQDAQAATCAQYIKQTWPITGEIVIGLIKDVLKGMGPAHQLPDGTEITACIGTQKFVFEVRGVLVSIAEMGELISWLGAALRTSPRDNGLIYCVPNMRRIASNTAPSNQNGGLRPCTHDVYEINFAMEEISQRLPEVNGQCWHDIFKNPVVVRGYPIPRRREWRTGLEISLNIMAGLAQTQRLNQFKEKTYIKGFSTMLFPTKENGEIVCWHLIYDKKGGRISYNNDRDGISYLGDDKDQEGCVGQINLENYRHVLGWCSEARLYAGSAEAHHPVTHSRLPKPHAGCFLAGVSVSEGKMLLNGPAFEIGAKDTPVYISRKNNIRQRLKWISTKFFLLWDELDKRGWLINGSTALLHIVRAFLSHAKQDHSKDSFRFRDEHLQEAETPFMADSAIAVLSNSHNRHLKLYDEEDGDDECLFKTQIDDVYNILEKLIDHQADIPGNHGSKLSNSPRRYLEGWDFEDVAGECPTIYPRVATIADAGKGWIDFIRAIRAVTLVGRGFGDIIKPASRDHCDSWATLPTKQYYIASCVSDLDRLLKQAGSHPDGYALLCDDLIYHAPATADMPCQCRVALGRRRCEPVRTLIPSAMSTNVPLEKHSTEAKGSGAVILGYNSHFPLIWGDTGLPQQGELMETEPLSKPIEEDVDSGFGSISPKSELESQPLSQSESETEYSAISVEFRPKTAKTVVPSLASPIGNNQYTRSHYTVGIICPLAKELKAVRALFDNEHGSLTLRSEDGYPYVLGDMAGHWIVAACLPEYGTNPAATVASNMKFNFPSIQFCLLVGIAGGVPSKGKDIQLGDVVVSYPTGTSPGVIQYDLGKENDGNHFQRMGSLQRPSFVLMATINTLQSDLEPPNGQLGESLRAITHRLPDYKYPGQDLDMPYQTACASCASQQASFVSCSHIQQRAPRTTILPTIHYGAIASGNRVIKDAALRNQLAQEHGILCFEMEAAGMMNTLDCLVIRGISDYCDGQKNDIWQNYAAATAAAYAKLFLRLVPRGQRSGGGSTEQNEGMPLTKKRRLD